MIRRLRMKFIGIIMVIVTIMLFIIFGILYTSMQRNLESRAVDMLRSIAAEPRRMEHPKRQTEDYMLPYFVLQLDHRGELVSTGGSLYDPTDEAFLAELLQQAEELRQETGVLWEQNLRYCQRFGPFGRTIAFCDMGNERNILNGMLRSFGAVFCISFLAFLAISIFFSKWAVKPVEKAWMEQKQFVADASHELKTPLTVIMTNAELLQSPEYDTQSRGQFLDSILIMTRQMRDLVEKMLELARADYQANPLPMTEVDLSRLAEEAQLSFEGVFYEKGLELVSEIAPNITIRGNRNALGQVLDILLDNARKYSLPGGRSKLCLTAAHGKCRLSVSNPGMEISNADLKNIFRRFYRIDSARSRDGSYGLGLPIARQITAQHHGRIWAESNQGVNTLIVELPL